MSRSQAEGNIDISASSDIDDSRVDVIRDYLVSTLNGSEVIVELILRGEAPEIMDPDDRYTILAYRLFVEGFQVPDDWSEYDMDLRDYSLTGEVPIDTMTPNDLQ